MMIASPSEFPPGFFSKLDSIHLHVDGGVAHDVVRTIVANLNAKGIPSRLTSIHHAIAGPQRMDLPPTYQSHTPGSGGQEQLEFFSTTLFADREMAVRELRTLLENLRNMNGMVVEAEMVIGKIQDEVCWTTRDLRDIDVIHSPGVGFHRSNTLPIEIHYGCDIFKNSRWSKTPPLSLEDLLQICAELEIRVGGWFLFEKDDCWAYRSNMFEGFIVSERVKKQRDDLAEHLDKIGNELGFKPIITALVERSLGVWKTPLTRWHEPRRLKEFRQSEELAKWEEDFQNLEAFWVVAGNFLGDQDDDVYEAMLRNLDKGVKYTYFLRSFADVQRLRQLAKRLAEKAPWVYYYITAVLLTGHGSRQGLALFQEEYFIANPLSPNAQGYQLIRDRSKKIQGGRLITADKLNELTTLLRTAIEQEDHAQGWLIPITETAKSVARAVMYTDLKNSTGFQEQFGDDAWEQVLIDYDVIVANVVSKLEGEVVKNLGDGYLLMFEQVGDALRCAQRLQRAIHIHNTRIPANTAYLKIPPHRIALDFGYVSPVLRSHGFDYAGKTLSRCARLIQTTAENQILILNTFRDAVRPAFPFAWIDKRTRSKGLLEFKGLSETYEVWELDWTKGED